MKKTNMTVSAIVGVTLENLHNLKLPEVGQTLLEAAQCLLWQHNQKT